MIAGLLFKRLSNNYIHSSRNVCITIKNDLAHPLKRGQCVLDALQYNSSFFQKVTLTKNL